MKKLTVQFTLEELQEAASGVDEHPGDLAVLVRRPGAEQQLDELGVPEVTPCPACVDDPAHRLTVRQAGSVAPGGCASSQARNPVRADGSRAISTGPPVEASSITSTPLSRARASGPFG